MRFLARVFTRVAERYLPDAFVFLFFLTVIVLGLGLASGSGPRAVLDYWGEGFFTILEFTMQSTLMLVTGYALAKTPPVHRALRRFARVPRNEFQIIALTALVVMVCSWISWGFGLIAGGLVAREMGVVHRGRVHYPLVVAAAYSGFLVWHAGYGGAIPQLIASQNHFLVDEMGVVPVSETIFSPTTVTIVAGLAIAIPITMGLLRPPASERIDLPESVLSESESDDASDSDVNTGGPGAASAVETQPVVAERLETTRVVTLILGTLALLYLVSFYASGGALDINMVVLSFLALGLVLSPNVREYLAQVAGGAKAAGPIIVQFPFYGALMGVMVGTGLVTTLSEFFVRISTDETLAFWAFISGGIVNVFVPSGGGQWAVQGSIMMEAATELDANHGEVAMGVAWGDAWTNMIQPFWALPLLAVAGLGIRQIMGYTAVALLVSGAIIGAGLLLV